VAQGTPRAAMRTFLEDEEDMAKKIAIVVGTIAVMTSMVYGALSAFVTPLLQ
jgi:hypothetical protein